jgi:pullulanase/glycogen debranching enzyme
MLATLLLSQGTPMLLAGDEFGRTQQGNNNAYCQDNEISWLNWDSGRQGQVLISSCRSCARCAINIRSCAATAFRARRSSPIRELRPGYEA